MNFFHPAIYKNNEHVYCELAPLNDNGSNPHADMQQFCRKCQPQISATYTLVKYMQDLP